MEELLWEERLVKARTASASVCYSSCTVPARGRPHFKMRSGLVSLGCGVNGEDGGRYTFLVSIDRNHLKFEILDGSFKRHKTFL